MTSYIAATGNSRVVHSESGVNNICNMKLTNQTESQIFYKSRVLESIAELKWLNIVVIVFLHGYFLKELFQYRWIQNWDLIIFNTIYGTTAAVGVSAGAHRLWTHRSYKAKLPLRIIWMTCYCFAAINPIFHWVRDHRLHHKYTDTNADPHNSKRGFFFSHVGWLMMKKHPDVLLKGKQIDMSDVLEDPVIQFHQKYYPLLVVALGFVIPTLIPLLWGQSLLWSILTCFARYVIVINLIWTINSVAHIWGTRPYDKYISSTDGHHLSFFTVGEAWHNYHHAFPWSYKFGRFAGFNADLASFWIDVFAKIGWAYRLKTPSLNLLKKAVDRAGDGSHPLWGAHMEIPESAEEEFYDVTNNNIKKWVK